LLKDPRGLRAHIIAALQERSRQAPFFPRGISGAASTSAVLFLLAPKCTGDPRSPEPCVVLNKRSARVKQPGDLCFPGGRVESRMDPYFARLLRFPLFPLGRWPFWPLWRKTRYLEARRMGLLFAASLREALEEMRLNPLGVTFLGPLPPQSLVMFDRTIYPMVGWIPRQRRFLPNWEVEKMIHIPLRELLRPARYGRLRIRYEMASAYGDSGHGEDFLCFLHRNGRETEVLWGATFRIVLGFLEIVFGFIPPDMEGLPTMCRSLDQTYLSGTP
jgi:8-oxo-dGTP pyrophosphatase MutT (NUDIX family)